MQFSSPSTSEQLEKTSEDILSPKTFRIASNFAFSRAMLHDSFGEKFPVCL